MQEKIIILDFGSQTTQLIGRRVRELDTYCEIIPYNKFPKDDSTIKGVILSGSPFSVYDKDAFKVDLSEIRGKYPILGICYGAQYLSYTNGGKVEPAGTREYGRAHLASFCKDNIFPRTLYYSRQIYQASASVSASFFNDSTSAPSTPKRLTVPSALISKLRTSSKAFKIEDSTSMFGHAIMVEII